MPGLHKKNIITSGVQLSNADKVLIMLHGRGADAEDILGISRYIDIPNSHILAPNAANNTWYPYSFLNPVKDNEPWLSSALNLISEIVSGITEAGFTEDKIYLLGFSQGACLTLEYAARNARKYGGIIAFSGGLIGEDINTANYSGDFNKTKIFIGTSNVDLHIPLERAEQSRDVLLQMNAEVTLKVYENMPHTIIEDELSWVNKNIFNNGK